MASVYSKEYQEREWWWRFYRAAYRGGREWYLPDIPGNYFGSYKQALAYTSALTGAVVDPPSRDIRSFLLRFEKESPEDYQERRAHSYYPGYPAQVVDTYTAHVTAKEPTREGPVAYDAWLADPMGDGIGAQGMPNLITRSLTQAQIFGTAFAVTDMDEAAGPITSEADREGLRPYTYVVSPIDVPTVTVDPRGRLTFARIRQYLVSDDGSEPTEMFRCWTATETWLEAGSKTGEIGTEVAGSRRPNPIGRVPVSVLYSERDPEGGFYGLSRIRDIAFVAREIYNLISQRQMILYHNAFPWLMIPDKGNKLGPNVIIGNRQAIAYDPEGGTPSTMQPPLEGAQVLGETIKELVLEIRGLAGLSRGRAEESVQARSGDALLVETQDKGAMLRKLAANAESFELDVADCVMRWSTGKPAGEDVRIAYPHNFNVQALADELDEALKIKQLDIPPAAWKAIVDDLVRRRMADRPKAEVDAMLIEPATEVATGPEAEGPEEIEDVDDTSPPVAKEGVALRPVGNGRRQGPALFSGKM